MLYKIQKKNPYYYKKVCFSKCVKSFASTILIFGMVVTISGRMNSHYQIKKAEEQFSESISYYKDEITITAQFFEKYGKKDPKYYFELYTQLLWNGYFSEDQNYQYSIDGRNNVIGNFGIKIATGKGDCKNNEDFFCKLMNQLGYHAYQIAGVELSDNNTLFNYIFGNHVITVVENDKDIYYFDTTNFCSYKKERNSLFINSSNLGMMLNPITSYIYGYSDIENLFHLWKNHSEESMMIEGDLKDTMEYSKVLLLRKKIEPSLQNICESIVKEG